MRTEEQLNEWADLLIEFGEKLTATMGEMSYEDLPHELTMQIIKMTEAISDTTEMVVNYLDGGQQ